MVASLIVIEGVDADTVVVGVQDDMSKLRSVTTHAFPIDFVSTTTLCSFISDRVVRRFTAVGAFTV